ncbi:MAG: hypothetical protein ABSF74_01200 [Dehalococcoidia bacterium]|jgi:hypothetical protein
MASQTEGTELVKKHKILACTGELIFTGTFVYGFEQRLIDAMNEGVKSGASTKIVKFVPLEEVTMTTRKGGDHHFSQIYLAKSNIIFIAQHPGISRDKPLSTYPFRPKTPVGVTIYAAQIYVAQVYAAPYILKGKLYIDTWGQVADAIEGSASFIPLTQVEIEPALPGGASKFDFMAINTQRIISISEDPGS